MIISLKKQEKSHRHPAGGFDKIVDGPDTSALH
jgi:hypothetical protein